jgi:hypothetical protein
MKRFDPWNSAAIGLCVIVSALGLLIPFAQAGDSKGKDKAKSLLKKNDVPLKIDESVGDLAKVPPMYELSVEGVGLVYGLDNTGSDPVPSGWRSKLLDEMKKAGVRNAEKLLANPTMSLVLIKGKIPAGITTEDVFDVQVELDPGSTTTSLAGGILLKADLFVGGFNNKGELLSGQKKATVSGAIMTGTETKRDDLRAGRILGGAKVKSDVPYFLIINEKRQNFRTSAILQKRINTRFSHSKGSDEEGMARAKTDQYLLLSIPRNYHHNQYRYFQVVENLPILDSPELTAARTEKWGKELLDPKTAGTAALRLEGLGRNSTQTLKLGLADANPQVRFFAAEALAYLGDDAGVDVLSDAAKNQPVFRAFALAALAAMDQPASSLRLKELLSHPDSSVRYGAFNALRIVDRSDPFLGRVSVWNEEPEPEAEEGDALAMRIAAPPRKKHRRTDPFELYVVDCEGPPLVHVARTRRCEIVVFGNKQKLQTPMVLSAGPILVNASDGDQQATLSRVGALGVDGPDQKVSTGLALSDVIREAANLGATYPEILSLLQAADRQKNLPGAATGATTLVVDALPQALAAYEDAQIAGKDATAKSDPNVEKTSAEKAKKDRAARKGIFSKMFNRGK